MDLSRQVRQRATSRGVPRQGRPLGRTTALIFGAGPWDEAGGCYPQSAGQSQAACRPPRRGQSRTSAEPSCSITHTISKSQLGWADHGRALDARFRPGKHSLTGPALSGSMDVILLDDLAVTLPRYSNVSRRYQSELELLPASNAGSARTGVGQAVQVAPARQRETQVDLATDDSRAQRAPGVPAVETGCPSATIEVTSAQLH